MLNEAERARIGARMRAFESDTGAQIVVALVRRSDSYPEIAWKAFALGASLAALARVASDVVRPDWTGAHAVLGTVVAVLAAGVALALAALRIPALGRRFVHPDRAAGEVLQHARTLFLRHEVFATGARNGVLILASRFERCVAILPDTGLAQRIADGELERVIGAMRDPLAADACADALCAGIEAAGNLLRAKGWQGARTGEPGLPNTIIEEDGDAPRG